MGVVCVCLYSNRCCQRNVYTHSDHSHCFENSLWGGSTCYLSMLVLIWRNMYGFHKNS